MSSPAVHAHLARPQSDAMLGIQLWIKDAERREAAAARRAVKKRAFTVNSPLTQSHIYDTLPKGGQARGLQFELELEHHIKNLRDSMRHLGSLIEWMQAVDYPCDARALGNAFATISAYGVAMTNHTYATAAPKLFD